MLQDRDDMGHDGSRCYFKTSAPTFPTAVNPKPYTLNRTADVEASDAHGAHSARSTLEMGGLHDGATWRKSLAGNRAVYACWDLLGR